MPLGDIIGGALGAIGGISQAQINARAAKYNTDQTILANRNMAEYAYSKDVEMWNRQNEYNSPEAQIERFKDAGLNPNLMYGQGSSGNATSLPHYNAPTAEYNYKPAVDIPMALSMFQDMALKQAQTDNVRAIADANKERAGIERLNRILAEKTIGAKWYKIDADAKRAGALYDSAEYNQILTGMFGQTDRKLRQELMNSQIISTSANAMRTSVDTAIKNIQHAWMKKIGVTNFGAILNAISGAVRVFK